MKLKMITLIAWNLIFVLFLNGSEYVESTLTIPLGFIPQQHLLIHNEIVLPAPTDECEIRYEIIKQFLDKYHRPFTLADIGACQGYYSFKGAADYKNSIFVMIEGDSDQHPFTGTILDSLCNRNNLENIIHLNRAPHNDDMAHLSTCEHFDVVLAMHVMDRLGDDWHESAKNIISLGDNLIVEIPTIKTDMKDFLAHGAHELFFLIVQRFI